MHVHDRRPFSPTREELRASMLNAAIVLRDVSFLRHRTGGVSVGCRAIMRQHAMQWRQPPLPPGVVLDLLPHLDARDDAAKAA